MKTILFALLLFCSSATGIYAQNEKELNATPKNHWQVGLQVAPTLNFRAISNDNQFPTIYLAGEEEQGTRPNWILGVSVGYCFKQLSLETGLQWSNYDFQTAAAYNIPPRTGPSHSILPSWSIDKAHYNYVGLPLKINYFIGRGRIKGILGIGAVLNYMYSQESNISKSYYNAPFERKKYPLLMVTPQVNVGAEYVLNNKISIRLEPLFRFNASNIREENSKRIELLYGVGLMASAHWNL